MTSVLLSVIGCAGSFAGGYCLRPRVRRRLAELELARAQLLIRALRDDIAELPAAIYSADAR